MAGGPGGPIVGKVRLRVAPDVSGFRREVEKQMAGLRDAEVNINPDMDGFRKKVNASTRGLKATVATDLNSRGLRKEAAKAAKAASGHKVYFRQEWRNRIKGPGIGPRDKDLRTLGSDLKFLGSQAKDITLYPLRRSADAAGGAIGKVNQRMKKLGSGTAKIATGFGRGMTRTIKGIGRLARSAVSPAILFGKAVRWATFGPQIERGIVKAIGGIRKKVVDLGSKHIAQPMRKALDFVVKDFEGTRRELGRMSDQMKEMWSGAGQAMREEFGNFGKWAGTPFRKLHKRLEPVRKELGLMGKQMKEMSTDARKVMGEEGKLWRKTLGKPFRAIGQSFKNSGAYEELQRMGNGVDKVRTRVQKLNQSIKRISITNIARKFTKDTGTKGKTADPIKPLADSTKKFAQSLGGTIPQLKSFKQEAESVGATSDRTAQRIVKMGKSASKSAGPMAKFKKAWGKFHQPENRIFGLTEMGWMAAAITALIAPLSGLIGGVLGSLPALGLAAAAALGATVLGWEGIKEAAEAAEPAVENAKEVLSGTFKDRLTPQFEALGEGLTKITPNLDQVANGLSDFSQGMVDAVTSGTGIKHLQKGLDNTANLFSKLQPFAQNFTEGLLEMGAAGSETFDYLGEKLNNFGTSFRESVSEMADTGVLQDSIESMYDVIGSIGTNLGRVMRAGMEELPDMAAAFTRGLDGIGDGLVAAMPLLSDFSQAVFDVFGVLGRGIEAAMPTLTNIFDSIGPGLRDAFSGLGDLMGPVLETLGSFLEGIAPGVGDILSGIGDGFTALGDAITDSGLAESAGQVGEWISGMVGDIEEAAPRFQSSMEEMKNGWEPLMQFFNGNYAENALREGAEGVKAGVEAYGGAWSRFFEFGTDAWDSMEMARSDIMRGTSQLGDTVEEAASNLQAKLETAMAATEIDLSPQIKKLDSAKTSADINEVLLEVAELLDMELSAAEIEAISVDIEPEVNVDPNITVGDMVGQLQSLATSEVENLQGAIDEFIVGAEAIAAEAEIDISPQIKMLQEASNIDQFRSAAAEALSAITGQVDPEQVDLDVDPQLQLTDEGAALAEQMQEQVSGALEGVDFNSTVQESLDGALGEIDFTETASGVGTALGDALGGIEVPMDGLSQAITTSLDTVKTDLLTSFDTLGADAGTKISAALNSVSINADGLKNTISSTLKDAVEGAGTDAEASASTAADGIINSFTEELGGLADAASEALSDLPSTMETKGSEAGESMASGLTSAQGSVTSAGTGLKTAAVLAVANISLYSSGLAAGNSFASGLRASIPTVEGAASDVAGAARAFFPNSPADKGAFSAGNYVDKSGMAVARDFAKGMASLAPEVEKAAASVTAAAHRKFQDFASDPAFKLEDFHRNQILQPVLEGNARKIHDWREREAESAERLQERIAEINESDSDQAKKEERIAKAREDSAERSAEAKERLLESLEAPEYRDINRSIQSYYIDGMRNVLNDGLLDIVKEVDLAGQTRDIALAAVKEGRKAFGSHPLFDTVEASVTADHFARVLQKVIEDSGIAEIPVDFAVSNLEQLKSDLGMGDGVISRALDQAISVDPAETDARWARQNPVEIHYHVQDMEAAIRLEQERERKGMMKYR